MKKRAALVLILTVLLMTPSFASAESAKIPLVAVGSDGKGIMSSLEVEIVPGRGRILLTAEPLTGVNAQSSERVAAEIAGKVTKTSLEDKDVIFTIHSEAAIVDGPSAGAAMTVAAISAITGNAFRNDTILTGTIEEDGTVGQVGGVLQKAKAVTDAGAKQFLIPKGQKVQTEYVKKTESPAPGIYIESLQPVSIDVVDYAKSKWDLNVREVGSINDVVGIMFSKSGAMSELALPEINITVDLELPNLTDFSKGEEKVKYVAQEEIKRATAAVSASNSSEGRKLLTDGQELFGKGYFYSAANSAFLGAVIAKSQNGSSLPVTELKAALKERLAKTRTRLVAETNSTDVYNIDEPTIHSIASAQQRYLWAENAIETGDDDDANSLAAAGEWLYAFEDMLHDVKQSGNGGRKTISRTLIQAKADAETEAAQKALMNAEAIGGDTTDGARAFGFALLARSQGLPLAQLFNAIDAESYALAASESGSLASLVERAKKLQDGPAASSGWGASYMKHSKYLRFMARLENSRNRATDAIFMALRARGVDEAFSDLPQPPTFPTIAAGGMAASNEDVAGITVFLAFTIAVWIMWMEIRAMRREQGQLVCQIRKIEEQLLIMKPKFSGRRRQR